MALSIVPILLSLLAPTSTAGNDLVVRVADKDGKPVQGVQVGLCPVWPGHSTTAGIGVSDAEGNARIEGALDTVRRDTSHDYFVRLGMPAEPDVRVDLDREHLDAARPTLVVPPHGRVVLKLPAIVKDGCRARLRCVSRTPEVQNAIWSGSSLPQIPCKDGLATAEFVGLGLELEYEVLGESLPQHLRGRFRGPTKADESITFAVPGFDSSPRLLAILVDEEAKPILEKPLSWSISWSSSNGNSRSSGSSGGKIRTGPDGRVTIPLSEEQAAQARRFLQISTTLGTVEDWELGGAQVEVPLPDTFHGGSLDLGRLMLADFGSPQRFAGLDDLALEKRFLELHASGMRVSREDGDPHEEILCEMVRRGGAELERFVAECAGRVPNGDFQSRWGTVGELQLRTALARMRHEADPVSLTLDEDSKLDVTFPEVPRITCLLKNVDPGGHSYPVFARLTGWTRIEVRDEEGRLIPQAEIEPGQGWDSQLDLSPGDKHPILVPLDAVFLPHPGLYRVRVFHRPGDSFDRAVTLRGRLALPCKEFTIRLRPRNVVLTRARMDALREAIRALDLEQPPPLLTRFRKGDDGMSFTGPSTEPHEVLFRAGFDAVPALYEALEERKLETRRRAWVFVLLWDILGGLNPKTTDTYGSIGATLYCEYWPSSAEAGARHVEPALDGAWFSLNPTAQAKLTQRWLESKSNFTTVLRD